MLVDSHCHLDFPDFADELPDVVARARAAGVCRMVTIGTSPPRFAEVKAIAARFEEVYCALGVHPHQADPHGLESPELLLEEAGHDKMVGIGESGLDYFYDKSPRERQQKSFRVHAAAARETGLPLIVHTRDADDDTARILAEESGGGALRGVLHCFSSGRALAEAALDLGFYVSFSGILTFKRSDELREIAAAIPLDRMLVETDAPYLAPVPRRGKRNEPAFVAHTASVLAEVKGIEADELAKVTTDNFFRLFNKMPRPSND